MYIAPSGRKYYRADNGSVMVWNQCGKEHATLILDSCYRTYKIQCSDNSSIVGLSPCMDGYAYIASDKSNQFTDPTLSNQPAASLFTDEFLDSRLFYKDPNTSRHNTNCINRHQQSADFAAGYCYSMNCSLPNIQTLIRLFCDAQTIDMMDPSSATNADRSLTYNDGGWFSQQIPSFAQSSSECDFYYSWCVLSSGLVGCVGKSDLMGGVIPVYEYY